MEIIPIKESLSFDILLHEILPHVAADEPGINAVLRLACREWAAKLPRSDSLDVVEYTGAYFDSSRSDKLVMHSTFHQNGPP